MVTGTFFKLLSQSATDTQTVTLNDFIVSVFLKWCFPVRIILEYLLLAESICKWGGVMQSKATVFLTQAHF